MKKHKVLILIALSILISIVTLISTNSKVLVVATNVRKELPKPSIVEKDFSLITEPDQGISPVIDLINNAKISIDLVIYEITDKEICDALIQAQSRGVSVRVILNKGYYGKKENTINDLTFQYLEKGGVEVHWSPIYFALTHQKTLVVDKSQALIMTWNFVPKYYPTGRDFGILDTDEHDVKAISDAFDNDWDNEQASASYGDDLVWSPDSENDILLIIKSATKTLDIYNEEIKYDQITQALKDAVSRGVNVRLIMTYTTLNKPTFTDLANAGILIKTFSGKKSLYIHAKIIVADKNYAFLGSENFSFTSLNKNRELGIFLSDLSIIDSIMETFDTDWRSGKKF